jgi:magnesium-transporting ATPase (P-type)
MKKDYCILLFIFALALLFILAIGLFYFHGKQDILNPFSKDHISISDFISIWTLQITFSTILLAVGGFLINFFNEKILGISISEISKKKGIWQWFLGAIILDILPILIYIFLIFSKEKSFKLFGLLIALVLLVSNFVFIYVYLCKVLELLLNKKELEEEIKNAMEKFIDEYQ